MYHGCTYRYGQHPVEDGEHDLLVDVHTLQHVDGGRVLRQVVMGQPVQTCNITQTQILTV